MIINLHPSHYGRGPLSMQDIVQGTRASTNVVYVLRTRWSSRNRIADLILPSQRKCDLSLYMEGIDRLALF